jgi:hypothetical protein
MKRIDTHDPERLEYGSPRFWLRTLVPLLFLAAFAGLVGYLVWSGNAACLWFVITLPLFLLVRGWLTERKRPAVGPDGAPLPQDDPYRLVFDRREGTLTVSRLRWLTPQTTAVSLDQFESLRISRNVTVRSTRSGPINEHEYTLHLLGPGGTLTHLDRGGDYFAVRKMAVAVGAFLGLDVVDAAEGSPVVLAVEDLGKPVAEQAAARAVTDYPPAPEGLRWEHEVTGDGVVFRVPFRRISRGERWVFGFLPLVALLAGVGVAVWSAIDVNPRDPVSGFLCSGLLAGAAGLLLWFYRSITNEGTTVIRADARGIAVTEERPRSPSTRKIAAAAVQEIRVQEGAVKVITDRESVALGTLPAPQAEWVRLVLLKALAG